MPRKLSFPNPPKAAKPREPKVPVELGATYWAESWAEGSKRPGMLSIGEYCIKKMKATVTYVIEQAKLRRVMGTSKPFLVLSEAEAAICLKSLSFRGTAKIGFLNLDLRRESNATSLAYFVHKEKTSNGRATAGRSELWAAILFGMTLFQSGDAPGSDGYILFGDTMELVSVKGLGKTGFAPQISSLTAHGTRNALDLIALLKSINLTAWIVVVDTTMLPQVQLTMIPSSAVADWARGGLISGSGLKPSRLAELVAASCHIEIIETPVIDRLALARQNKIDALADSIAMAPLLEARRVAVVDLAARSASPPLGASRPTLGMEPRNAKGPLD